MTRTAFLLTLAALCLAAPPARAQSDEDAMAALLPIGTSAKDSIKPAGQNENPAATLMAMAGSMKAEWHLTAKLPYDAPAHVHFFRYQRYLLSKGLAGLDQKAWDALDVKAQEAKLKAAEALLKERFTQIAAEDPLEAADKELVDAVWGVEMGAGLDKLAKARATKDPEQIKLAEQAVAALSQKLGNIKGLDPRKLFDNAAGGGEADADAPKIKDFLAPDKANGRFPASLDAPEIKAALQSEQSFAKFLIAKKVPPAALPGLMAMYQVQEKATGDNKAQMAHIMPTVARFLLDGHHVELAEQDEGGTLGMAVPDAYGNPQKVMIYPMTAKSDPTLVGDTLSHEFEHVYDFYAGRPYTLDSELRGFKTDVLYMRALKQASPEKYEQMRRSANDETRSAMDDVETLERAYAQGPDAFMKMVAYGHHYNRYSEGTFSGRLPLREAADPSFGAARQLYGFKELLVGEEADAAARQKDYDAASKAHAAHPTPDTSAALQIAAKDLAQAQQRLAARRYNISILEVQVGGLQAEARWLQSERPNDQFDLSLPVDNAFVNGAPSRGASK